MATPLSLLDRPWRGLLDRFGDRPLRRVSAFLDVFTNCRPVEVADPRQRYLPRLYFPGLTARPWHDPALLPSRASEGIREDYLGLLRSNAPLVPYRSGYPSATDAAPPDDWNVFYFHRVFRGIPPALGRCPAVRRLLSRFRIAREAFFSILEPGARVLPHSDGLNFLLTAHLGVVVPRGCGIRVGGEERAWREGEWLLFDSSFDHEVWNRSASRRGVLVLDLWHPELTATEVSALRTLWRTIERIFGFRPRATSARRPPRRSPARR